MQLLSKSLNCKTINLCIMHRIICVVFQNTAQLILRFALVRNVKHTACVTQKSRLHLFVLIKETFVTKTFRLLRIV